jgi:multidrug efflux system outer membrane protein
MRSLILAGMLSAGVLAPAVAQRSDGRATIDVQYWQQLGDTTLNRLIAELHRSNLDVRAAEARVSGARENRTRAVLDFTPSATFSGGYSRQRLSSAAFPGSSGAFPDQDIWDAGFDASWELDVFGRIRKNVQAQGALVDFAEEDQRDVMVSLTAELARAYFDLRGAQEQLAVATRNADNQQKTLSLVQQRLDAGRGSAFDTERAKAQLSTTLASIPSREAAVRAAQYRIGVLVGRAPAALAQELGTAGALPELPAVESVGNPDSVVRNRPDVAAAERFTAAQHALVGVAKADYLPRFSIGGRAGYTTSEFSALGNEGTFRYAVGPVVTWQAFNLGRVKTNVSLYQAREEEARAQYDQAVLAAQQDIQTSLVRYQSSRASAERLAEASAASERAAELARMRFTEGVADFLQVLDAERTQLESQERLVQSRIEAASAYAALYKATGGK